MKLLSYSFLQQCLLRLAWITKQADFLAAFSIRVKRVNFTIILKTTITISGASCKITFKFYYLYIFF